MQLAEWGWVIRQVPGGGYEWVMSGRGERGKRGWVKSTGMTDSLAADLDHGAGWG
jgi:hypothetical protein